VEVVVNCYKLGTDAYIIKNDRVHVELERAMQGLIEKNNLRKEVEELRDLIVDRSKYYKILGDSPAILKVLRMIQKVEKNDILVMVTGESGTGKELVAKAIHYNSPRKRGSFVAVNMAAIPEDLVESELFGHEKGAYTGADSRRIGKFEEANGGTIFLDEIGECDHNTQLKLLRVLQEGKLMRLGSNKELDLDLRVIAATNKNLSQRVKEGKFREDLYYRLQGFLIHLPPLKDRGNDAMLLARHFLKEFCAENKLQVKGFSKSALDMIAQHPFPGNVRELKATIERAALLTDGDNITADDLVFSETI
jgi:DNA-binding NtrC family response regulator